MFSDSNILIFIFSFLPGLIYSSIIYLTSPVGSIRIKTAINYLSIGFLSALLVLGVHYLFPHWQDFLFASEVKTPFGFLEVPNILSYFFLAFIQVGLLEELSKFATFRIAEATRGEDQFKDNPVATMFYCTMIGLGFAIFENILYGSRYGEEVLLVRNFTALIMHMCLGIFMGYLISLGRQNTKIVGNSNFSVFLKRRPKFKKWAFRILAVVLASAVHGLYDFNLFIEHDNASSYTFIILGASIAVSYFMGKHLFSIFLEKNHDKYENLLSDKKQK